MTKNRIVNVNMGKMVVGEGMVTLRTLGIGSCMVVCLYDRRNRKGGMIHSMFPERDNDEKRRIKNCHMNLLKYNSESVKYVDEGIDLLVEELKKIGGNRLFFRAKICGGASMIFPDDRTCFNIGSDNIKMAKKKLQSLNIKIEAEDVGGACGRWAEFDLSNGELIIKSTCSRIFIKFK